MSAFQILLVTGLSGAGKSTTLKSLEDLGWDVVDNFPLQLIGQYLETPRSGVGSVGEPPIAFCFDSRTRGFAAAEMVEIIKQLGEQRNLHLATLFLECNGAELERRYAETRRRHPLAQDRPARDGIAQERGDMAALRRWADHVLDTSAMTAADLRKAIRENYSIEQSPGLTVTITSFGFSRGVPNNVDLLFDVRFLSNPFWVDRLKLMTGLDQAVAEFVSSDPAYEEGVSRFRDLILFALPRYQDSGKAYVNIGIGCTGGRHRSVHVAERLAKDLHNAGFSPTVVHRNLASRPLEALEAMQPSLDRAKT